VPSSRRGAHRVLRWASSKITVVCGRIPFVPSHLRTVGFQTHLLGQEGDGFKIAMKALDTGRIGIAAQAVGIGQAALDASLQYAKERIQFRVPLARHQAIQIMLAEMGTMVRRPAY